MNNLQQTLSEGRLIRGQWSKEEDGKQLLCLYTALVGDPKARPESCPASLCPSWLAHLLPYMDDKGTSVEWAPMVERVARLSPRFGEIKPETEWKVRALIVREAMTHGGDPAGACSRVAVLCERQGSVGDVTPLEFAVAAAPAEATWAAETASWASAASLASWAASASSAAAAAAAAAASASAAARAAAASSAVAAAAAARATWSAAAASWAAAAGTAAARAAAAAAWEEAGEWAAASRAMAAAMEAAWDRMTDGILNLVEEDLT